MLIPLTELSIRAHESLLMVLTIDLASSMACFVDFFPANEPH